jgi:prephenate dehydrogenase
VRIAFLGFGLISGSMARALRASPDAAGWDLAAWSPSGTGAAAALADGVIDRAAADVPATIDGADLVVLGGPATACLDLLDGLAGPWSGALSATAVVTDVASTKAVLLARADALGIRYVGGHPMAGLDTAGYAASTATLFVDRPWVIVPGAAAAPGDGDVVAALARACHARPVLMDAAEHDAAVAAISHLPLVLAAALVEAVSGPAGAPRPDWPQAAGLAAGGWRDMTRLARGDAAMGAGILATNGPAVATRLRDLRAVIDDWLAALERPGGPGEAALAERLTAARTRLEETPGG